MNSTVALRHAVEQVYSGAELLDAECIEDKLHDLGFEVVPMPAHRSLRPALPPVPAASTAGLPKQAAP